MRIFTRSTCVQRKQNGQLSWRRHNNIDTRTQVYIPQHVIYDVGNNYTLKEPNDISETTNETKHKPILLLDTYYADVCLGWTSGDISCLACA